MQLVFKQNRPLWERAFLGALCTCNGLVCSLQSHLCSFFSFYKDKQKKQKTRKKQQTASDPLPLGCLGIFGERSVRSRISFCQTFPLGSTLLARANPDCALLFPVKSTDRQTERQHLPARQPSVYGLVPYFLPALEPNPAPQG